MKKVLLGILIMAAGLVLWGCSNGTSSSTTKTYTIRFEVTGTVETAHIHFTNELHEEQNGVVTLPWEKIFTVQANDVVFGFGLMVTRDYNADYAHDSSFTATIFVDGKETKTASDDVSIHLTYLKADL